MKNLFLIYRYSQRNTKNLQQTRELQHLSYMFQPRLVYDVQVVE